MKIYVVLKCESYEISVDKVFLNKKDADDYAKYDRSALIEEHEVIE